MLNPPVALTWARHLDPVQVRRGDESKKTKRRKSKAREGSRRLAVNAGGDGSGGGGGEGGVDGSVSGSGSVNVGATGGGGNGVRPAKGQLAVKGTAIETLEDHLVAVFFFEDPRSEAARHRDDAFLGRQKQERADNLKLRQTKRKGRKTKHKGRK
jgi:hypothetical protein